MRWKTYDRDVKKYDLNDDVLDEGLSALMARLGRIV
jgi:hypothetical protein